MKLAHFTVIRGIGCSHHSPEEAADLNHAQALKLGNAFAEFNTCTIQCRKLGHLIIIDA